MSLLLGMLVLAAMQDDIDPDTTKLPADADRPYRLALWDEAEKIMRDHVRDGNEKGLAGLAGVLYHARKNEECVQVCDRLLGSKDPGLRATAYALKAACAFRDADLRNARAWCDEALRSADAQGAGAVPGVRRLARRTRGFLSWRRVETEHVTLFHPPESPIAGDAAGVAARLDGLCRKIAAALDVPLGDRIDAYLFNDQAQADEIVGLPLNVAIPRERTYFALHGAAPGHEIAHILSFYVANRQGKERPRSAFLVEGVAAMFTEEPRFQRRLKEVPAALLREERLNPLAELLGAAGAGVDFRAPAGSFAGWLYEKSGKAKFLKLWAEYNDHKDPWLALYGRPLSGLDAAWRESLR